LAARGIHFKPFFQWEDNQSPYWWKDHNDIKHHKIKKVNQATLYNLINSTAAVFCILWAQYGKFCYDYMNNKPIGTGWPATGYFQFQNCPFKIKDPQTWTDDEKYDLDWVDLKNKGQAKFNIYSF